MQINSNLTVQKPVPNVGMIKIYHDASLAGDGTQNAPLSVAPQVKTQIKVITIGDDYTGGYLKAIPGVMYVFYDVELNNPVLVDADYSVGESISFFNISGGSLYFQTDFTVHMWNDAGNNLNYGNYPYIDSGGSMTLLKVDTNLWIATNSTGAGQD